MLPVHTPRPRRCKATVGRDSIKEWNDVALKIAEGVLAIRHDIFTDDELARVHLKLGWFELFF
jgi:hypothetical protein